MTGTALTLSVELTGLEQAVQRLAKIGRPGALKDLLEGLGAEVEAQTKTRIEEDKAGPDGTDWPDWDKDYAKTRHDNQSLLQAQGGLLDSIRYYADNESVAVGSNLVYAAIHQFGGAEVGRPWLPARPYLGLSDDDTSDLEDIIEDHVEALLQ